MKQITLTLIIVLCIVTKSFSQGYWDSFCQGSFNFQTNDRIGTNSPDSDQRAQVILVNAWIMFEQGKAPEVILDSLDFMSKQILYKNKKDEKAQAIMNDQCFNNKYRTLLDSLRKDVNASSRYAKAKKTELAKKIFELTTSLPAILKHKTPCTEISVSVTPDQSLVIVINVKDCRADAEIDDHGYPRGQLGYPDIYQSILDWYVDDVLKPLGKTLDDEKSNTIVELKGKADGNPVLGDLHFGQTLNIPKGKQYTVLDYFDIPSQAVVDYPINSFIPLSPKSNEYLALSRACLAEPYFQKIGSQISIVTKEYVEDGEDYRGVEIKITAKKLLEEYAALKLYEEKSKALNSNTRIQDLSKKQSNSFKGKE